MSMQHAQYMLLFLVLVVNSNLTELHALTVAACSCALLLYVYMYCALLAKMDVITLGNFSFIRKVYLSKKGLVP